MDGSTLSTTTIKIIPNVLSDANDVIVPPSKFMLTSYQITHTMHRNDSVSRLTRPFMFYNDENFGAARYSLYNMKH